MFKKKMKSFFESKFFKERFVFLLEEPFFWSSPSKKYLINLKDKYKGERCFVVGNGPSINNLDLTKLNDEFSFGVNGIFYKTEEMGYKPTFYVVEDTHVMKDNIKEINNYATDYKFFPTHYKKYVKNRKNVIFFNMNRGFYEKNSPYFEIPRFSVDCAKRIYCGQSVTIINLQLAYYLGFKEVFLIGMDFSYKIPETAIVEGKEIESTEDDINHFHPEYFGKGKKWHDPKLENVLKSYKLAKLMFELDNRKIYNATLGGKLEVFERVNYKNLF